MDLVREVGDCDIDQNSPEAIPPFNSWRNGFYRTCKVKLSGGGLEVFEPSSSDTLNRARRRMGLTEQLEPGSQRSVVLAPSRIGCAVELMRRSSRY